MASETETHAFDAAEYLDTPEMLAAYMSDALNDSPAEFLAALGVVSRAHGMSDLARRLGVNREALYRSLSASGHPDFSTIVAALDSYGLQLTVTPKAAA